MLIHSSLDQADRRGARFEASTEIFLHLGRLWTASHNSCGSRPVHSRMLSMYSFCSLPRFLPPLAVPCSISLASALCLVFSFRNANAGYLPVNRKVLGNWRISHFFISSRRFKMLPTDSAKMRKLSAPPCQFIPMATAGLDCISDEHYST